MLICSLHPYFDAKTDKDNPIWMMVDVKFVQRLPHPPTLALIKHLATVQKLPECVEYIGQDGLKAVQTMQLVNRGRLSE
jgi:protein phosphatase-4 regulatory subunit 3